jgi:hypothetical protein
VLRRLIRRAVSQHVPTPPRDSSDPLYPEATHRESTILLLSIPNRVLEAAGTRLRLRQLQDQFGPWTQSYVGQVGRRIRVAGLRLTTPSKSPRTSTGRLGASPHHNGLRRTTPSLPLPANAGSGSPIWVFYQHDKVRRFGKQERYREQIRAAYFPTSEIDSFDFGLVPGGIDRDLLEVRSSDDADGRR